VAAQPRGAVVP